MSTSRWETRPHVEERLGDDSTRRRLTSLTEVAAVWHHVGVFDVSWMARVMTAVLALFSGGPDAIEAAFAQAREAAQVSEWADRGDVVDTVEYAVPVADVDRAGWGDTHSTYAATDIFAGCGAVLVSPVDGVVLEVRRVNSYDPAVDNPATRGGLSVAIAGNDGVRYYLAHFDTIVEPLAVGDPVAAGDELGTMGDTGRTSACHAHFGISPPCPDAEWSVRRGVVWPYPYLDAWRSGEQLSPVAEVETWAAAHPNACAEASAHPNAGDS